MLNERIRKPVGRRPSTEGRKIFGLCVGVAFLMCAVGLAHTWTRVEVTERGYRLALARTENERLHRELAKLNLELEALQNATRVDRAAREVLHMAKASRVLVMDAPAIASQGPVVSGAVLASNGL
jgi:cell division protein FtsL